MERNLSIRLSVKDHEAVKRALEAMGKDGQAALKRIEQAGEPASRSLLALNAASQTVQGGVSGLAGRAGPLGSVLAAIGPGGMAAAAGIGAVAVALTSAVARSREATEKFSEINKVAGRLGVTTNALQELRYAAERVGAGAEAADEGLKELGIRAAEAAEGAGEGVEGFKKLGISQDELKSKLKDIPALFELVIARTAQLSTTAQQAYTLDKIFGDIGGEAFTALTARGADGLAQLRREAHSLGVVIEKDMLDRATETNRQLSAMSLIVDTNLNQAFVDLAPVLVSLASGFATVAQWIAQIVDGFREIETRSTRGLTARLADVDADLARLGGITPRSGIAQAAQAKQLADLRAEKAALEAELAKRGPVVLPPTKAPAGWSGAPAADYAGADDDPVEDAKARFQRAVQSFSFASNTWDQERATRDSLDQTARELMEYANQLREPQRKMLEDQAKEVQRLVEANTKAQVQHITRVGDAIDRSLADNLSRSASNFQSWGDGVRAIIADVANALIQMYMVQSSGNSIGGWIAQGIGSWVGGLGGGTTPGTAMTGNTSGENYFGSRDFGGLTTTGGPRAAGGQVFPNIWYPTNERRAEDSTAPGWFMPVRPGVISPDSHGGGGGGTVHQNFQLSVTGASAQEVQQLQGLVSDMAANFENRTLSALQSAKRSGKLRSMGVSS